MESCNLIESVIGINNDINMKYRLSKYPRRIKNFIAERERKKLKKSIDSILSWVAIPADLLTEYIERIYMTYPPCGNYESCIKISPIDIGKALYASVFQINMEDNSIIVAIASSSTNSNSYMIRYTFKNKEGKTIVQFADDNVTVLKIEPLPNPSEAYNSENLNYTIRSVFASKIVEDIHKFLSDTVERSERINL